MNGNWKYRNGRVHGCTNEEKGRENRERMRQEVKSVLDTDPVVGQSGRHLMEAAQTILTKSYQRQKAWIQSINVEVAKEKKRVTEQWRQENTQRHLEVIHNLRESGRQIAQRVQQNFYWYFRLPDYLVKQMTTDK